MCTIFKDGSVLKMCHWSDRKGRRNTNAGSSPRFGKGFFSQSQLPVQTLLRCPYSLRVQSHASTAVRTLKIQNDDSILGTRKYYRLCWPAILLWLLKESGTCAHISICGCFMNIYGQKRFFFFFFVTSNFSSSGGRHVD